MKFCAVTFGAAALASGAAAAASRHQQHTRQHTRQHRRNEPSISPRGSSNHGRLLGKRSTCDFPTDAGLVAVTPGSSNGGWAMSPDQSCTTDSYCPYACPPGQVMAQWEPDSTTSYPSSMNGGLYCNSNGELEKPFSSKPYCVDGAGSVSVVNQAGSPFSFCQTVYPGNEAMLIPTVISSKSVIAVPDPSYWCSTASHFYINPPGVGAEGCIWGSSSEAIGNWSPYVAGANTDSSGVTYLKVGWNPEWLNSGSLSGTEPDFSLSIECDGCNGLPCSIDPSEHGINGIGAPSSGEKSDTGSFCVISVPSGSSASIVVTSKSGSGSSGSDKDKDDDEDDDDDESDMSALSTEDDDDAKKSKKVSAQAVETTTSESTTSSSTSSTTSAKVTTTPASSSTEESSSTAPSSTSNTLQPQYDDSKQKGGIFVEKSSTTTLSTSLSVESPSSSPTPTAADDTSAAAAAAPSDTQKDEGVVAHQGGAVASLVIALVVGLYLF